MLLRRPGSSFVHQHIALRCITLYYISIALGDERSLPRDLEKSRNAEVIQRLLGPIVTVTEGLLLALGRSTAMSASGT